MRTILFAWFLLWAIPSAQAWQLPIDSWVEKLESGNRAEIREARDGFEKLARIEKNNPNAVVFAEQKIAWCDFYLGNRIQARKRLSDLIGKFPNHPFRRNVERDLGNICEIEWRSQDARLHLTKAIALAKPLVTAGQLSPVELANIQIIQGTNYVILGQNVLAKQELEAAQTLLQPLKEHDARANLLLVNCTNQLSSLKERQSRIFEAIEDNEKKLTEMQAIPMPTRDSVEREFSCHTGLARISRDLTRFHDAENHHALAETLLAKSKITLGEFHHDRHREELEIAKAELQIEMVKVAFEKAGFDNKLLKELEKADNLVAEARRLHDRVTKEKTKESATTLIARGAIHKLRGQLYSADRKRQQAQTEYKHALNDYSAAYQIFLCLLEDPNLDNLLEIQRDQLWLENQLGNGQKALQMARRIWKVYQKRPNQVQSMPIHQELIELESQFGNLNQAQFHAQEHRTLANQRLLEYAQGLTAAAQQTFFHRWYDPGFQAGLRVAVDDGIKGPQAPVWLEKSAQWVINSKAKSAEVLASSSQHARNVPPLQAAIERQSYLLYGQPAGNVQDQLLELESEKGALLEKQFKAFKPLPVIPFTVNDLKESLQPGELLIDIVCVKDADNRPSDYYAWLHNAGKNSPVRLVHLGKADVLEPLVADLVNRLETSNLSLRTEADLQQAAQAEADLQKKLLGPLSRQLLLPIWNAAGKKRKWIISPDGELWNLPWAAFLLPNGDYAIEELTIRYAISARDVVQRKPKPAVLGPPVLLTRPDFNKNPFAPQKGTFRKNRMIGLVDIGRSLESELKKKHPNVKLWQRANASKANVLGMQRPPKTLYLGTHGQFLVPKNVRVDDPFLCSFIGLSSYNVLPTVAPIKPSLPGVLTAAEVLLANLEGCELVVLAGCQTGRGIANYGHSSSSLRHAFHLAGARAVVSTQWSVLNDPTNALMMEFMRAAQAPGKEKAEALRETQIKLIRSLEDGFPNHRGKGKFHSHPVFWAAFSISGF